jgi:AcrR family transcriptional regulator
MTADRGASGAASAVEMARTPDKPRRRRGEARQLILDTARELFASRGYERTSFLDIADTAEVSESLIFRRFRTKARLFEEAVLDPYHDYICSFMEHWWSQAEPMTNQETVERFVGGLYDLLTQHRDLVGALVSARYSFSISGEDGQDSRLSRLLDELAAFVSREADQRNVAATNLGIAFRLVVGQVMAAVLLDDWLFPRGARHPTREQILDELIPLVCHGTHRSA